MTFREHPPVKIAFGDGGCYIMHLRCMTLITQIVLCVVQKVNEKKENKMGILVDSPKKNEYNVKQFDQDEV